MLLGLLCLFLGYFINFKEFQRKQSLSIFVIGLMIFSSFFTLKQTPWEWEINRPKPNDIRALVQKLSEQESVSVLWYGNINPQILNYYYLQNNSEKLNIYRGPDYNNLWSPWDYSDKNRSLVSKEIIQHFEKASLIIIPEFLDQYQLNQPYAINHFRNEFLRLYSENLLPPMYIVGRISENNSDRLLVLSKNLNDPSQEKWKPVMRNEK